jgi:anti-sigma B factor antagonist
MQLRLSERSLDGNIVVGLRGELDLSSAPDLRAQLLATVAAHPGDRVILDLSGVPFMDSASLNVLLDAEQRAGLAGGTLCLAALPKAAARAFEITGIDMHFAIFRTVADAAARHSPGFSSLTPA